MTVRVLIADDHPVVRAGVTALLGTDPDIEIVATASTPAQTLAAAATTDLDLMLLDLQFSSDAKAPSGVEVTRKVRSQPNPPEVLILTNYDTDADILAAVEAGATGYLLKDAPAEELLSAIHRAARGEGALAPAVATRLMARMRSPQTSLTARELDVLGGGALQRTDRGFPVRLGGHRQDPSVAHLHQARSDLSQRGSGSRPRHWSHSLTRNSKRPDPVRHYWTMSGIRRVAIE